MITSLKPNEIFVFGSNASGIHGGGAAHSALSFGALFGESKGSTGGQTYGIETLDINMNKVPLEYVQEQLMHLNDVALQNPLYIFLLTPIGTGIAGFSLDEIEGIVEKVIFASNIVKTWNTPTHKIKPSGKFMPHIIYEKERGIKHGE